MTDPAPTPLKGSYFSVTKKDFQPRVGFAWGLNGSGKTVLRSGFGIFHDHILPYSFVGLASGAPPYWVALSDQKYPVPFPFDTNLTAGPSPPPTFGVFPATVKEPSKTSYTLSLQQELMKDTLFEVAYIGSESHHLQRSGEWNPIGFTSGNRINPNFATVTASRFDANANYNALQVTLKRRSASGLQYQAFYTYAKSIDTKSTISGGESRQEPNTVLNFLNPGRDRARSSFDARHNFVVSTTYPFPFQFQKKLVRPILVGWTISGIGTFRPGEPFTARVGRNISGDGNRWTPDRPNLNPGFSNNPTSGVSKGCPGVAAGQPLGTPDLWYDPCAFSRPAPGTYGNVGRNTLTGPGFDNVDASLAKVFKPSGEQLNVQLRAEVFNLFDHANFYVPGFNVFSGSAGHITRLVSPPGGSLIQLAVKITF